MMHELHVYVVVVSNLPPHLMPYELIFISRGSLLSPPPPVSIHDVYSLYLPPPSPCMADMTIVVVSMKAVESSHHKRIILYTVILYQSKKCC